MVECNRLGGVVHCVCAREQGRFWNGRRGFEHEESVSPEAVLSQFKHFVGLDLQLRDQHVGLIF